MLTIVKKMNLIYIWYFSLCYKITQYNNFYYLTISNLNCQKCTTQCWQQKRIGKEKKSTERRNIARWQQVCDANKKRGSLDINCYCRVIGRRVKDV